MADTAFHNLPAPAKLNLFLHVVGRQDNGYHLLQSVFMLIDWQDSLDFTLRTDEAHLRYQLDGKLPQHLGTNMASPSQDLISLGPAPIDQHQSLLGMHSRPPHDQALKPGLFDQPTGSQLHLTIGLRIPGHGGELASQSSRQFGTDGRVLEEATRVTQ